MVFSSTAIVRVADASVKTWQRMGRIPPSEMLNTEQIFELACCLPLAHLVLHLWEFLCFPLPGSHDTLSSSSDDDDYDDYDYDYDDEISYGEYDEHDHRSSSLSSTLDFDNYYHYSYSD